MKKIYIILIMFCSFFYINICNAQRVELNKGISDIVPNSISIDPVPQFEMGAYCSDEKFLGIWCFVENYYHLIDYLYIPVLIGVTVGTFTGIILFFAKKS